MNKIVSEIQESVSEILSTVSVINDIASRTSLLSMNAAIEAAHAGIHGKGFAVVAGEISKLSESTEQNAQSINNVLEKIRARVNRATDISGEADKAFTEINSEVQSVTQALSEINLATEELSNGGEQIIDAMYILQDVSLKVRKGATEMKTGAEGMGNSMEDVRSISGMVLERVTTISSDSKVIENGAIQIHNITEELSTNTTKINNEINRFKTE